MGSGLVVGLIMVMALVANGPTAMLFTKSLLRETEDDRTGRFGWKPLR